MFGADTLSLDSHRHSFASLPQKPPGGDRSEIEIAIFKRALAVMAFVYASLKGTAVLQLKDVPPRPKEYDGCITLFGNEMSEEELRTHIANTARAWTPTTPSSTMHFCPTCSNLLLLEVRRDSTAGPDACRAPR